MDVVEALEQGWERPPFELTRDDTYFYGRGTLSAAGEPVVYRIQAAENTYVTWEITVRNQLSCIPRRSNS